jgi:hypothetical protein
MVRLWASIANKLGITQDQGMLLYAYMRGWLKVIPHRQAEIVLNDIIERFALNVYDYGKTYGAQLHDKGVLTSTEAEVFSGNYHEQEGSTAETRDGRTPAVQTGLQPSVHAGRTE